jgi:hypothetical protein
MSSQTQPPFTTPHPATAPAITAESTPAQIKDPIRKGGHRVTDNTSGTTRSWNELRDEATAISLALVDAGGDIVTFRISPKTHDREPSSSTRKALTDLVEHGGGVRILGPAGSEEGVRQS